MITLEEILQLTPAQQIWCTHFATEALGYELDYSQIHNDFVQDIWRVAVAALKQHEAHLLELFEYGVGLTRG